MEGSLVSPAPLPTRLVRSALFSAAFSLVLAVSLLAGGCASAETGESLRGEVVDSRTLLGPGDVRYLVTVECREATGTFSRLTFEVNQDEWMRFHSSGQEVCVLPQFAGGYRLIRCN